MLPEYRDLPEDKVSVSVQSLFSLNNDDGYRTVIGPVVSGLLVELSQVFKLYINVMNFERNNIMVIGFETCVD